MKQDVRTQNHRMRHAVKLDRTHPVSWPRKCAACNRPEVTDLYISTSKTAWVLPLGVVTIERYRTQGLRFPVCREHKSLIGLMLFFQPHILFWPLTIGTVVLFFAASRLVETALWAPLVGGLGAFTVFLLWLRSQLPVLIEKFDGKSVTVSFRNSDYARDFEAANSSAVLRES